MAKKKRRFVGPTKEAAKLGLATAAEGKLNTPKASDPVLPVQTATRTKPQGIPLLTTMPMASHEIKPLTISGAPIENEYGLPSDYGRDSLDWNTEYGAPAATPQEARARAVILGYYQATHRYPSPEKVMMLMNSPLDSTDPDRFAAMWSGADKLPPEMASTDIMHDTGYENLHGFNEVLSGSMSLLQGEEKTWALAGEGPVPADTVKAHMAYLKGFKAKRDPEVIDIINQHSPENEMVAYYSAIADRLRRRGAPVEFDEQKPWGDPDALKASFKYAAGRQWAFSLWGTADEQAVSNQTIAYLRQLPLTDSQLEKLGVSVGVEGANWDGATIGGVMAALRHTDDDFVHKIVYDGWMFGRLIGQSPSQARMEYAYRFGLDRLPLAERQKYEESNRTVMGMMATVTEKAGDVYKQVTEVPVLGVPVASIGWAAGNLFKAFNYPLEIAMRSLVTVYDIANQADRNMTIAEYQEYLRKTNGKDDEFGWNWSVFADTAAWANAWEEAEGKTPVSEIVRTMDLSTDGKESPASGTLGQLADFSVMMYVGAKVGDPVMRTTWYGAKSGTFAIGRPLEKALLDARGRRLETGLQRGELDLGGPGKPSEVPAGGYKVGDKVRVAKANVKDIEGRKLDVDREVTGEITEAQTLPDGTVEYKVSGAEQPWHKAEDIIGLERRTGENVPPAVERRVETTNEAGVKVSPVEVGGETVAVDASIAEPIERLNAGGYKTHQSHGLKEDHPVGHDARKAEPYVEFAYKDILVDGSARIKAGLIRAAAKRAGAVVAKEPGGKTFTVTGDVAKFTDELMPIPDRIPPAEPPGGATGSGGWEPGAPTELENALFRLNSEVIATVDDPATISWLYQIPEDDLAAKAIAYKLAKTQNVDKVEGLLDELRTKHGIDIDGGAGAVAKNIRQAAYRRGFGYRTPARLFITPVVYGKTHGVEGSSDMLFNVAAGTKMGREGAMNAEDWSRVRYYRRRMFDADRPMEKQTVIDEFWDEWESNLGEAGLAKYKGFRDKWYWAQGHSMLSGQRRAYYGEMVNGTPHEVSRTSSRSRAKARAQEARDEAQAQFDEIVGDTNPALSRKAHAAMDDAQKQYAKVTQAIDDIDELMLKKARTEDDNIRLEKAHQVIDAYGSDVPFKMQQAKKNLVHRHNPRIAAWYSSGEMGRGFAIVDQAVMEPAMRIFKETVMASLGFPLRVNIGDEVVRLIPEGTIGRMRSVRQMKRELKEEGLVGDELTAELHDRLAYDWAAQESGDWILATKQTHPRYFEYLKRDLDTWKNEPIIQRLVAENDGVFPREVGDVQAFIRKMAEEDTGLGREMRQFLEDTYRFEGKKLDNVYFDRWAAQWQDRLETIAGNDTLRAAMTKDVPINQLEGLSDDVLWPVNAPEQGLRGRNLNTPATFFDALNLANPFHYVYQGFRVPVNGTQVPGTLNLLGAISKSLRETVFADKYYLERKAILKNTPDLDPAEIHQIASSRAMRYTNQVTYSRSSTLAEDMARNLLPFVNAYRQFWQYWIATFFKHPVSISVAKQNYPMADPFVSASEGPFKDLQAFMPSVPFWGTTQDGEDPSDLLALAKQQLPQASFLVTGGARTLIGALGDDPARYKDWALLSGLSGKTAPYSRPARLLYGLTGFNSWDEVPGGETLFGDPQRLEKAHVNAILGQLAYDENGTGPGVKRDKPWWWRAMEDAASIVGMDEKIKPEALFGEAAKTLLPFTLNYSPKDVRERGNLLYEYYDAQRKGDPAKAAELRAANKWLDVDLSYYDATEEEKVAMKKDPENASHLKFWVSAYNYDQAGMPYDGREWATQFETGLINYKSEDEIVASVHNLYTDVYGGTYMQSAYRDGGTSWVGDQSLEQAKAKAKAKVSKALAWANKTATLASKTRGWDKKRMMWNFQNPDKNWGIWPEILRMNGLDPAQYNISLMGKVLEQSPKLTAGYLNSEDVLRALDLEKFIVDPKLAQQFETETPFKNDIAKGRKAYKDDVVNAIITSTSLEQWYDIGSQQLAAVGIDASPKIDLVQLDLNKDYTALGKLTVGTSEYKAARNAYYAKRDKVLGSLKGGKLLTGGIADRLAAVPFVMEAQVTSMGTGAGAEQQERAYRNFIKARDRVLSGDDPDSYKLKLAWDKLILGRQYAPKQDEEIHRVAAWAYLLAEAKHQRYLARTHYSEYYEAKGESAASKYGTARADELNTAIKRLRTFSPAFSRQLDDWFGTDANIGYQFIDWYSR